ncbi:hypothetical protein AQB9606_00005 [Aquabacterium sp. CECT 9606]|nr:hypothetical protein AQB9606_00005 [Aquabacterium sp. CECT 9606]
MGALVVVFWMATAVRLPQLDEPPSFHTENDVKLCVAELLISPMAMRLLVGSEARVSQRGEAASR